MANEASRGGRGRIPDRDIAAIRERVRIEDIVGDYVQLRRAGVDSLKGLCPFHDEKSPSFHVRPNHGHFHCFGCGEGGDVYAFLQKIEHVNFVEAVELLADKVGYTVTYSGGAATNVQRDRGSRSRLIAANAAAVEFYAEALRSEEAAPARQYLIDRNFDAEAAARFGCGFAPAGWDRLTKHLLRKGFEFKELEAAGLSREGKRGPMDRFHRRLLWPIRVSSGETIGFGARRLFDDDHMEAKYVNTPETVLYKKSHVLFGLDLAKRDIAKGHQAVVVEGYTDVMAMHLAGVSTAVAACGTAFGDEHLSMLRRLMMDDNFFRGELIYVFDGDAAGRAAAVKAFEGEQNLAGQSFVAVASEEKMAGMDPCDIRLRFGDSALRDLVARRAPLFEFAIRTALADHDLDSAEGRVAALRRCVPMVSRIKDPTLRDEYARQLAGWVGWDDVGQVLGRGREEGGRKGARTGRGAPTNRRAGTEPQARAQPAVARPNPLDPTLRPQREALKSALQYPGLAGPVFDSLSLESFTHPAYAAVRAAITAAGGVAAGLSGAQWIETVRDLSGEAAGLVNELGVDAIGIEDDDRLARYISGVLARLQEVSVGRQIAEVKSKLQRMSPVDNSDEYHALFGDLVAMETYRRSLLEQASGDDLTA